MRLTIDIDERYSEEQIPEILRKLADTYGEDRYCGDEGGTVELGENSAADWEIEL